MAIKGAISSSFAGAGWAVRRITSGPPWLFGALALAAAAVIYVGQAWTPSHYGMVFDRLGLPERPFLGLAQPVRSDEYFVLTPYFQIAVRNNFGPRNEISPYKESLKSFWALPIADWGLVFKPQLWGFWILPPAYAFSLYFFSLAAAFVVGYGLLLRQLGASAQLAVLGSLVLWSSHLVQVWWTSNAAVFALAPWPAVAFLARLQWHWRWAAIWYASAVWLIGLLYPPFIISGALGLGVLLLAFRRDAFTRSRLALAVSAVVAAIAVTWLYFHDIIDVMQGTVYPGQRRSVGGGVPLAMLAAHVFPYWTTVLTRPLLAGFNACDISVVASFLPLMFAVFTNYRSLADVMCANASTFGILIAGLTLMLTWMILPVPHEVGRFLLLDLVPANRTLWGFGLCLTAALVVVMTEVNWHITPLRCAVFVTLILAVQIVKAVLADPQGALADLARALPNGSLLQFPAARFALGYLGFDLVILAPFAVAVCIARSAKWANHGRAALLASVAATSMMTFGIFNPLQSARPIFDPPSSRIVEDALQKARAHPRGWAVLEGHQGAVLNGLGVPAINHVLLIPQLDFFRPLFPDLSLRDFNDIFNRYAHIVPASVPKPQVRQVDVIVVPMERFELPSRSH